MTSRIPDLAHLAARIREGDRSSLAQAITLVESTRDDHRAAAAQLLDRLAPDTGCSTRIGLTGVPGSGKSTLIDGLGSMLTARGHSLAVLAVDPTSPKTGGSVLGDKTRMARLAVDRQAFVRPSPTSRTLGGVAAKTRETLLLCEAAGFDIVIVETVGVGQSETAVSEMVDVFLLLMLPGAGDELQGIKKGVLEVADIIAVNKADGDGRDSVRNAAGEIRAALNVLAPQSPLWTPPVLAISARTGDGIDTLWETIGRFRAVHDAGGMTGERRARQNVSWLWSLLDDGLRRMLLAKPGIADALRDAEIDVRSGRRAPMAVAEMLFSRLIDR